jgi:hypothetical protein
LAFATRDGLVFALLYGRVSDWAMNVLAADEVKVMRRRESRTYGLPRLVRANEGLRLVPAILRPPLRLFGVRDFLLVSASLPAVHEPEKQKLLTTSAAL